MQALPRLALRQTPLIQRVQPTEDGVAAHGLAVGLQDDRLTVRRHLDGTSRHAQRPLPRRRHQGLSSQPCAHAVGLRRQLPGLAEKNRQRRLTERHGIATGDHPQQGRGPVVRPIRPGHAGGTDAGPAGTGQQITLDQRGTRTIQPTQALAHLRADTAQHWLGSEASSRRQVEILTANGEADLQELPCPQGEGACEIITTPSNEDQTATLSAPQSGNVNVGKTLTLESPSQQDTNAGQNITWKITKGKNSVCSLKFPSSGAVKLKILKKGQCNVKGSAAGVDGQWNPFTVTRSYRGV